MLDSGEEVANDAEEERMKNGLSARSLALAPLSALLRLLLLWPSAPLWLLL